MTLKLTILGQKYLTVERMKDEKNANEIHNRCTESSVRAVHPNDATKEGITKNIYAKKDKKQDLLQEHQRRYDTSTRRSLQSSTTENHWQSSQIA